MEKGAEVIKDKNHHHLFIYGDIPGLGECKCGMYKVLDEVALSYEVHARESESSS